MKTPNFSQDQYIDAPTLNNASALVSGDFALAAGIFKPGLVFPEAASYPSTGLAVQANLPSPFAVLFGNGLLAQAHGTITGQDSQSTTVNFSGAVPGTGSTTAYLVASYVQIQQNPFQVIGPPVGHPDYNPNFTPYTAYSTNVDSLSIAVTTTPPDNVSFFELFRATLAAGATGVAGTTIFQQRTSGPNTTQVVSVSGNFNVAISAAGKRQQFIGAGIATLPPIAQSNGLSFSFSATVSGSSVQVNGADVSIIFGSQSAPASGVSSISIPQGSTVALEGDQGIWQIFAATPVSTTQPILGTYNKVSGSAPGGGKTCSWLINEIIAKSGIGGTPYFGSNLNVNFNGAGTGLGGMDTGGIPVTGDVNFYLGYVQSSNTWGVFGTTQCSGAVYTGGNLPAGVVGTTFISAVMGDPSGNLTKFTQIDDEIYVPQIEVMGGLFSNPWVLLPSLAANLPAAAIKWGGRKGIGASGSGQTVMLMSPDSAGAFLQDELTVTVNTACNFENFPVITPKSAWFGFTSAIGANSSDISLNRYTIRLGG